jgi:hypothetical protein
MALYFIRYVCEGSLTTKEKLSLSFQGHEVKFNLPGPGSGLDRFSATITIEGTSWQDADINAQKIIQPCLDALSFSTGQTLLLLNWELILKGETGSE